MEGAKILEAIMAAIIMTAMLIPTVSAKNITVGGSAGWDLSTNFTFWSASAQIFVNDTLQFLYTPSHDVIEVRELDFISCDTSSPIFGYNSEDGETLVNLTTPGPRYFVCGRSDHCTLGLKVHIQVQDSPMLPPNTPSSNRTGSAVGPHTSSGDENRMPVWWVCVAVVFCILMILFQPVRDMAVLTVLFEMQKFTIKVLALLFDVIYWAFFGDGKKKR